MHLLVQNYHRIALGLLIAVTLVPAKAAVSPAPVNSRHGMVVSSHRLASQVGCDTLKSGGNAIDAAIATGLALAVVHPGAGNLGGGGFMVVHTAKGEITSFDFREQAPTAATREMYLDSNGKLIRNSNHQGYRAVGVPGTIAGFDLARKRFGTRSWSEITQPAIRLARDGFPLSAAMAEEFASLRIEWLKYPESTRSFLKADQSNYKTGDIWRQPLLAQTLDRLAEKGRDGFYSGETAYRLAALQKYGSLITEADLQSYSAHERAPIHGRYRGYDVYSMAPPSSGGIAIVQMLNVLEKFDLESLGHNSAQYLHLLTESMRTAFSDRARHLGDPDFNPAMPVDRLISKPYADQLRQRLSLDQATPSDLAVFRAEVESHQTTHYSVIDSEGNAVVVTYTLEESYGSKIVAEGLGFLLNNEMGDFNPQPNHTDESGLIGTAPNLIAPKKRMLSSMSPTVIAKDGKPWLLIGSPGGRTIINTVLQVILNSIDFKMDVSHAIAAGRIHHQWMPDVLNIEANATSRDTLQWLRAKGHQVRIQGPQGRAMGIRIDPTTGIFGGSSDPRDPDGAAVGVELP